MRTSLSAFLSVWNRKKPVMILAFLGFVGLAIGAWAALQVSHSLLPVMRMAITCPVSIVGLLTSSLLPLFVSALAVYFDKQYLIYAVALLKSLCFGFFSAGVFCAYHSAAWLVHFLLLFSDNFSIPVLCWFWSRHVHGRSTALQADILICSVLLFIVGSLDLYLISPFLANL